MYIIVMIKKIKFINSMSLALAAITAVSIIIACGKGSPDDIGSLDNFNEIESSKNYLKGNMKNPDFMSSVTAPPSSSSKAVSSSSAKGGSSSGDTSGSSSSNVQGNSSSGANPGNSSSGESPYILTCKITGTGTAGVRVEITKVTEVKCVAKSSPNNAINLDPDNDFTWSIDNLNVRSPVEGEYSIEVEVDENASACQGLTADCGTFTVSAAVVSSSSRASSSSAALSSSSAAVSSSSATVSSSSRASSSSTTQQQSSSSTAVTYTLSCTLPTAPSSGFIAGTAITARPTVTCTGGGSSASVSNPTFTGAPTWDNPVANTYTISVSSVATGNCSGKTVACTGTLTVHPKLNCGSVTQTVTTTQIPTKPTLTCGSSGTPTGTTTWTPNINNPITTTTSNVTVIATCGVSQTASCAGTITVTAPPSCGYQTSYCGGEPLSKVIFGITAGNKDANAIGPWATDYCFYVKGMTDIQVEGGLPGTTFKVNGQSFKCESGGSAAFSTCVNGIAKVDDGYYISRPGGKWMNLTGVILSERPTGCTP